MLLFIIVKTKEEFIMSFGMNSGYNGWSMSNRAVEAYENGERPLSKWSKKAILEQVEFIIDDEEIKISFELANLAKLTKDELFWLLLDLSSWHHTGKYCNETDFYRVEQTKIEELTNSDIENIISRRKPKVKKEKAPEVPNMYITALASWNQWEGTRNHLKKVSYEQVVYYRTTDKMVSTKCGNKRLSSLWIIKKVEQKTRYAKAEKVQKK